MILTGNKPVRRWIQRRSRFSPHICRFDPGQRHSVRRCLTIAYPEGLPRGAWSEKEYSGSFWRRPMLRRCLRSHSSMAECLFPQQEIRVQIPVAPLGITADIPQSKMYNRFYIVCNKKEYSKEAEGCRRK